MNSNNQNNNQLIKIVRKRGRPRKYINNPVIIDKNIEKDLILFLPDYSHVDNKEDELLNDLLLNSDSETSHILSNDYTDINEMKNIIKEQTNIIKKYEQHCKGIKIFKKPLTSNLINCPFECNNRGEIIIPEYTELCCFHDSCKIKGKPIFLPDREEDGRFYIIGWFCSVNCALAYNFNIKDNKVSQRISLITQLYKIDKHIKPAPDNKILKKYGGNLTIEEYRDLLTDNYNNYKIVISPIVCLNMYFEKF